MMLRLNPKSRPRQAVAASSLPVAIHRSAAFTFIEVLFAIMVLGIGFIMIAAIFPVAIKQTQATNENTVAASVIQDGVKTIAQLGFYDFTSHNDLLYTEADLATVTKNNCWLYVDTSTFPSTTYNGIGKVFSFNDPRFPVAKTRPWSLIKDNLIMAEMPNYAWVPFYRRDVSITGPTASQTITPSPSAQIYIVPLASRRSSNYVSSDPRDASSDTTNTDVTATGKPATLDPLLFDPVKIYSTTDANGLAIDVADFSSAAIINPGTSAADSNAIGEDAVIVVSDDRGTTGGKYGWGNGLMFRLGKQQFSLGSKVWQLSQATRIAYHMDPSGSPMVKIQPAAVFVIGRGWSTIARGSASGEYDGKSQEIAFTTTIVNVAPNPYGP